MREETLISFSCFRKSGSKACHFPARPLHYNDLVSTHGAGEQIKNTVSGWDRVEAYPHRFGGTEFTIGRREIGHIHGDQLVDIPFPKKIRDEVVAKGEAEPHHVLPETGWISFYIREEKDIQKAIDLLRRSYQIALKQIPKRLVKQGGN